jgi:hypothetical protein
MSNKFWTEIDDNQSEVLSGGRRNNGGVPSVISVINVNAGGILVITNSFTLANSPKMIGRGGDHQERGRGR